MLKKSLALYALMILIACGSVYFIVPFNQKIGIYDPSEDSIGIPIMITFICSGALLTLIALQIPLLSNKQRSVRTFLYATLSTLATIASSSIILLSLVYWLTPNHYSIATSYFLLAASYSLFQYYLYKKIRFLRPSHQA